MRDHKGPKLVPDKVAGLQSHQFSRTSANNRFNGDSSFSSSSTDQYQKKVSSDARHPRIGNNSKNESNEVFRFGGVWTYPKEKDRYVSDVARFEKQRLAEKREKLEARVDIKRNWKADIEHQRWDKMSQDYIKQQELWNMKHARTRVGQHSVHYNPITLEYHQSAGGTKLAEEDAKAMHRVATRSLKLYLKRNTFDPILGKDIPQKIDVLTQQDSQLIRATESGPPAAKASVAPKYGRRASQSPSTGTELTGTLQTPHKLAQQVSNTIHVLQEKGVPAASHVAPAVLSADVNQDRGWFRHY